MMPDEEWMELRNMWDQSYKVVLDGLRMAAKKFKTGTKEYDHMRHSIQLTEFHHEAMMKIIDIHRDTQRILNEK